MRIVNKRDGSKQELWNEKDLSEHLKIDIEMSKHYFKSYHKVNGGGYGDIEKHLILDFVNQKQREEREREARHQADIATSESVAVLKEQVKVAKTSAVIANVIALCSLILSIIALCLKAC